MDFALRFQGCGSRLCVNKCQMLRRRFAYVRDCGSVFLAVKGDTNDFGTQGPDYSLRVMHRRRREMMGIPAVRTINMIAKAELTWYWRDCVTEFRMYKSSKGRVENWCWFIKIMARGVFWVRSISWRTCSAVPSEGYFDSCKKQQLIFDCLCVTSRLIRHVIENGATGIEHGNLINKQTAKYLTKRDISHSYPAWKRKPWI